MLKRRLIPKLQLKAGRIDPSRSVLVTTVRFDRVVEVGDPVSQAKVYQSQAADELIVVDLDATPMGRGPSVAVVRRMAEEVFMPITVGGGVRSLADFREVLSNGADKVAINTAAIDDSNLIRVAAEAYGAQCVVVSIDYRGVGPSARVWVAGGRRETAWHPADWAVESERLGAGEILLTSIDRDGTRLGLDVEMIQTVAGRVSIPVIAGGGCGVASHFAAGLSAGADAIAAGTFFCLQDQSPMQARAHVQNAGFPIRMQT